MSNDKDYTRKKSEKKNKRNILDRDLYLDPDLLAVSKCSLDVVFCLLLSLSPFFTRY